MDNQTTMSGGGPGPGDHVGPYRLLEPIGEGGFGVVYLAEQHEPIRRRVALKLIKLGMDTREVIGRFEIERQALALMSHPNIAAVLDAGSTEQGRPYFVMELVQGVPITRYCDDHRLSTSQRLELFALVCRAVQHAHQKGVIHRDLKPSNVLVTEREGRPVPKVIDFGVAKAIHQPLTDATVFTRIQQMVGTPAYMSPEQSRMGAMDVDTRTDVYSLGALLYELLAGQPPLLTRDEQLDYEEFQRRVREVDPPTPSTLLRTASDNDTIAAARGADSTELLRREIRGELDWIVMKALEKDRNRRYDTAQGLALDVERRLRDEPVTAAPPSTSYRLRKLVVRNRAAFMASAAVLVALVGGLALASWGLLEARTQRDRAIAAQAEAESEARKATEVNRYLNELLAAAHPNVSEGEELTVRALLDEAAARLEAGELDEEPAVRAALLRTVGDNYSALGLLDDAELHLEAALEAARAVDPDSVPTAIVLERLGHLLLRQGRYDEATESFADALELRTRLGQEAHEAAAAIGGLAEAAGQLGDYVGAEARYREGIAAIEASPNGDTLGLAGLRNGLGQVLSGLGRNDEAIENFAAAVALFQQHVSDRNSLLATALNNWASALEAAGRYEEAERVHRQALETRRLLFGDEHEAVGNSLGNLGLVLYRLGRHDEAETMLREALDNSRRNLPPGHFRLATNHSNLALAVAEQDRLDEADGLLGQALAIAAMSIPTDHIFFPVIRANRADLWRRAGRTAEAEPALLRAHEELSTALGEEHARTRVVADYLATLYAERGDAGSAAEWRRRGTEEE